MAAITTAQIPPGLRPPMSPTRKRQVRTGAGVGIGAAALTGANLAHNAAIRRSIRDVNLRRVFKAHQRFAAQYPATQASQGAIAGEFEKPHYLQTLASREYRGWKFHQVLMRDRTGKVSGGAGITVNPQGVAYIGGFPEKATWAAHPKTMTPGVVKSYLREQHPDVKAITGVHGVKAANALGGKGIESVVTPRLAKVMRRGPRGFAQVHEWMQSAEDLTHAAQHSQMPAARIAGHIAGRIVPAVAQRLAESGLRGMAKITPIVKGGAAPVIDAKELFHSKLFPWSPPRRSQTLRSVRILRGRLRKLGRRLLP